MNTPEDFCAFFQRIERDPARIVTGLKVRDLLAARAHVAKCDACGDILDRVLAKAPPKPLYDRENLN